MKTQHLSVTHLIYRSNLTDCFMMCVERIKHLCRAARSCGMNPQKPLGGTKVSTPVLRLRVRVQAK